MPDQFAAPAWSFFALILCGLVGVAVLIIAVVAAYLMARRPASSHEVAKLREENARLRAEIERLQKEQSPSGSTGIKEM